MLYHSQEREEEGERAQGKSAQIFFYDDNCRSLQLNPTSKAREGEGAYEVNELILKTRPALLHGCKNICTKAV